VGALAVFSVVPYRTENMPEKFEHKKSLGQHFLNSAYVPKKMCDAADLAPDEVVFEIGPGTGALTKEILARGATVVALEADLRAIESLNETFPDEITSGQLRIHHGDARSIDFASLGLTHQNYKVVANIPYYISGLLFRTVLESDIQPTTLVFLVQKEVATRICKDTKESLLSLGVKAYGTPTYICTVSKSHFTPPPRVDSAVVAVSGISKQSFKDVPEKDFFTLIHLGFGQKRKQLQGNLSATYSKEVIVSALSASNISQTARAEDISLESWLLLAKKLQPHT
jgi:16S rRNA (adenine1518-N6/adenine1519-N6)-dimethyltransferase